MDYRSLVNKLNAIEKGDIISEGITIKDVMAAVQGKASEQDRAAILNDLAWKNNLPGLYDPVTGYYVRKQSAPSGEAGQGLSIAASASKDDDQTLAKMGLVPKNAKTSSALGRMFGASGDMYDKGVQATNAEVVAKQEREELIKTSVAKLNELLTKLQSVLGQEQKVKDAVAAAMAKQQGAKPSAGQGAKPAKPGNTDPTKGKVDYSLTGGAKPGLKESSGSLAQDLVESFGYEVQTDEGVASAALKGAGKLGARALPGVGLALGASDAWDRIKAGDYTGAALAGAGGVAGLIPGVGTAAQLGLMAANAGRDKARTGSFFPGDDEVKMAVARDQGSQAAKPKSGDPKLQQLQKVIGATPDGVMGPETKEKLAAWQQKQGIPADGIPGPVTYGKAGIKESTNMKSLAEQIKELQDKLEAIDQPLEEYYVDEDNNFYNSLGEQIEMDEGLWDTIAKGGAKLFKGIGQGFKNPGVRNIKNLSTAQKVGANVGAAGNKIAGAGKAAAQAIKNNPGKAALGAAALGTGAGYLGGKLGGGDDGAGATPSAGSSSGGQGARPSASSEPEAPEAPSTASADQAAQAPAEPEKPSAEVQAIIDEIRKVMADMSKIDDPTVKAALDNANKVVGSIPGASGPAGGAEGGTGLTAK